MFKFNFVNSNSNSEEPSQMDNCCGIMAVCSACLCSTCGIIFLIFLALTGIALGVIDIIIASKWERCHLDQDDSPDIYLYVLGGLTIGAIIFGSIMAKKKKNNDDEDLFKKLAILCSLGKFGVLIWGMAIFFDTDQKDCDPTYYDYGYYRTLVIFFLTVALACLGILITACSCVYLCVKGIKGNDSMV